MSDPAQTSSPFWHDPFWSGKALLQAQRITPEQLDSAIQAYRKQPNRPFPETLIHLGLIKPLAFAQLVAERVNLPCMAKIDAVRAIARTISHTNARQVCAIPVRQDGPIVTVAVADPTHTTEDVIRGLLPPSPNLRLSIHVAPRQDILAAIEAAWTETHIIADTNAWLEKLLFSAIDRRASDIHFEPKANSLVVRLRIDGFLLHEQFVPESNVASVIQALKLAANLDIAERRMPQDGRFNRRRGSKTYSFRTSTCPCIFGENVTLRIAEEDTNLRSYAELGMCPEHIAAFEKLLAMPNGVVIFTGPTGAGKTTLLYSALEQMDTHELKVVTVEDPVEYTMPAINQSAVNAEIGLTFARFLRTLVRQDPNIIVVGEIRDTETAQITTQAALIGRLCLTTLHTNDGASSVTRLIDLGVEPFLVASTVKGVLAQRLLRRLCLKCRRPHAQSEQLAEHFNMPGASFFEAVGCDDCRQTGYNGRIGIFEVFPLAESGDDETTRSRNVEVERLIARMGPGSSITERDLLQVMLNRGYTTLRRDGLQKAAQGLTTPEEVIVNL